MRRVASAEAMNEAFARCRSEAEAAFGSGALFVEKLIERPRHIEVQVLADGDGKVVHLHERDCSVQLRNQKVIETAPAPGLDADLRDRILADAIKLVAAAGYANAGTVEFLVVPETGEHFFIECNARIQVEHTVTEQVTGIDLVEAQFRIAAGGTLASLGLGSQDAVRAGDARTTLLGEHPDLLSPAADATGNGALTLLRQQATLAGVSVAGGAGMQPTARSTATELPVGPGQHGVACPMAGSILEIRVAEGDRVAAGEPLLIVSAMKMESQVASPLSGTVAALQPLTAGDTVESGQVVAVIAAAEGATSEPRAEHRADTWAPLLEDVATMQALAHKRLAPGSDERGVVRQRSRGKLTCRERIDLLFDDGSFHEIGSIAGFASYDESGAIVDFTPANHVGGWGRIESRTAVVCADDFTSRGGHADGAIGEKSRHLDLCDLFHLPVLNLVDNPGFAVGLEHEITGTIRWGGQWMIAFAQTTVPVFTVIMRRSFGVAGNNYATPRAEPSMRGAWPAADTGGIPPEGGIEAAYKRQLAQAEDPRALRDELMARIESARGPVGPLSRFQIEEMIDPRDTRRMICEWIETAWKIVSQPARLKPRPIQFRP